MAMSRGPGSDDHLRGTPGGALGGAPGVDPDSWLAGLRAHDRVIIHAHGSPHAACTAARNYLDAARDAYGLSGRAVNVVLGVHGAALPLAFDDVAWRRWRLGERFGIVDPASNGPATRNVFLDNAAGAAGGTSVRALQRRGVLVLACGTAMRDLATDWARAHGTDRTEELRALRAGLLSGVVVVPSMVVAVSHAQQRGVAYLVITPDDARE